MHYYRIDCLNFSKSSFFPFIIKMQGSSNPAWGKSTECLLFPVIWHLMEPPRRRNREHSPEIF